MRRLLYAPVIHMSADLGEISSKVSEKGIAHIGEGLWAAHMKTVDGFWFVLADFFGRIEAKGLKIYQDGMLANGDIGRRIVDDAVRKGSRDFEIRWFLRIAYSIPLKTSRIPSDWRCGAPGSPASWPGLTGKSSSGRILTCPVSVKIIWIALFA